MKREDALEKREKRELAVYRMLGVRRFRDCAFALERWRHRKDGEQNGNYHIRRMSCSGIRRHYAYLSYNALIHIVSLSILFIHVLVAHLISYPMRGWNLALLVLALTNLYCIMLQRYNALRIRQFQRMYESSRERRVHANADVLARNLPPDYPEKMRRKDCEWAAAMREALRGGRDFVIREEDAVMPERLHRWAKHAGVMWRAGSEAAVPDGLRKKTALYAKEDRRADWLRKRFAGGRLPLLLSYAVLTEGEKGEKAFSELFCDDTGETVTEVLDTFLEAGLHGASGSGKAGAEA